MNRTAFPTSNIFLKYPGVSKALKSFQSGSVYPILVHCHLSWDNVWQRPQQFLSRLAQTHPVLFVETHVVEDARESRYEYGPAAEAPGVTQLKVLIPQANWADGDYVDRERRRLVKAALLEAPLRKFRRPVQWFYDPMAVESFCGYLDECLTVYDCMDQLSQFRGAPPNLIERERKLLERADVVFCGGKKLHLAKSRYNSNSHFYGCGVDVSHFSQARNKSLAIPLDVASLPRPILGYYGVVDERLDYKLLHELARNTPGSVVMIGPLAKVSEASLPRHRNLHWLDRRSYEQLPAYAKAFDVCLMPFALNEATEYINPTKALEYLGAGRPVVSTAVSDVVALFSDVVHVSRTAREFIGNCQREATTPTRSMQKLGLKRAAANSWDSIVAEMDAHISRALRGKLVETTKLPYELETAGAV
jgi:glycosyltransferase involved in cell wall biosynthesis